MTGEAVANFASVAVKAVQSWSAYVVPAGALIAVFGGKRTTAALERWRDAFWSTVTRPFTADIRSAAALAEFRAATKARMDEILAELRPNGGTSIRDAIGRVEERQIWQAGRTDLIMLALAEASAVYETDNFGQCIWVSPAYCKITGRTLEECLGWGWVVVIHPDDAARVRVEWASAVEDRRPFGMHYRMVHADGHPFNVHSVASPRMIGSKLLGWSGLVTVEH